MLQVGYYEKCTTSEGPGKRFALWLQGCSIGCKGCINPELHCFTAGRGLSSLFLEKEIREAKDLYKLDGISILGGEPFDQPKELLNFLDILRNFSVLSLNIIVFTGYCYDELIARKDQVIDSILSLVDVLVDGKYDENKKVMNLYLRGSSNQNIVILNEDIFSESDFDKCNSFDIKVNNNGDIVYTGFPFSIEL